MKPVGLKQPECCYVPENKNNDEVIIKHAVL